MSGIRNRMTALKCKRLYDEFEALSQEYEAVTQDIISTLSAGEKVKLEKNRNKIEEQLELRATEIEKERCDQLHDGIEDPQPNYNRLYLELKQKLPRINFEKLEQTLNKIPGFWSEEDNCAALLLFRECVAMGGELCAERIRERLRDRTSGVNPWLVKRPSKGRIDELSILSELSRYLGIEPAKLEQEELFKEVVQKVCGSLHTGRVVLMEFWGWHFKTHKPELLCWILRFWHELVNAVEAVSIENEYRGVKCIALVFVDSVLPDGYIDSKNCCSIDTFERHKILEFSLEPWTKEDIKKWMVYCGLPGPEIDLIAERIYINSMNGLPHIVEQELLKECCPALTG